jgi:glycosyltransferase involved in cell wall biosynthesis
VPASSKAALGDAMRRLLDDPELRRRIGKTARQRILGLYHLADNTETLAHAFSARMHAALQNDQVDLLTSR